MIGRRSLVAFALALAPAAAAFAQSGTAASGGDVSVVKIMSFTCPVCRAAEPLDLMVTRQLGPAGKFVYAPVPGEPGVDARERYYYAARKQGAVVEAAVRDAFYVGSQDRNLTLDDDAQALVWLQQTVTTVNVDWVALRNDASSNDSHASVAKAIRLIGLSGATATPTYVVFKGAKLVDTINPDGGIPEVRKALDASLSKYAK